VSTLRVNSVSNLSGNDLTVPPGAVQFFARNTAPNGWIKANGAALSRSTYADLFTAIGTAFGVGDGSTTFTLPDMRGEFPRGWDDARGIDSGRAFGSAQAGMSRINHGVLIRSGSFGIADGMYDSSGISNVVGANDFHPAPYGNSDTLFPETRPRNIAFLACIKY
jgi:phage-related tail fiber protein